MKIKLKELFRKKEDDLDLDLDEELTPEAPILPQTALREMT